MTQTACADLVAAGDPDRYRATLAAPAALRADLFTLYAFNLEIARAPWVTKEPLIAEMRLQWWRDVVAEPAPRAHEVAAPLHALIGRLTLPLDILDAMIAARSWDIGHDPFADVAALDLYLDHTSGHLMWLAALICGAAPAAEARVRDSAYAAGMASFLRAVPSLKERGRRPLLKDDADAIRLLADRALKRLAKARASTQMIGPAQAALLAGWQSAGILRQAHQSPSRVLSGTLERSEFSKRGRLLWSILTGHI